MPDAVLMLDLSRQLVACVCTGESVAGQCASCRDRSGHDRDESAPERLPPSVLGHATTPFALLTRFVNIGLHVLSDNYSGIHRSATSSTSARATRPQPRADNAGPRSARAPGRRCLCAREPNSCILCLHQQRVPYFAAY